MKRVVLVALLSAFASREGQLPAKMQARRVRAQSRGQERQEARRRGEDELHAEVREGSLSWRSRFRTLALEVSQSYGGSRHSGSLLLARQAPVRGELIDEFRKVIAQSDQQVGAAHAGLLSNGVERLASERVFQIIWSDCLSWVRY